MKGVEVREVKSADSQDYVNLLTLRCEGHSIAGTLTRTHPCDAGRRGTLFEPWMARPPLKYFGR